MSKTIIITIKRQKQMSWLLLHLHLLYVNMEGNPYFSYCHQITHLFTNYSQYNKYSIVYSVVSSKLR